jgi:hypothetical protein
MSFSSTIFRFVALRGAQKTHATSNDSAVIVPPMTPLQKKVENLTKDEEIMAAVKAFLNSHDFIKEPDLLEMQITIDKMQQVTTKVEARNIYLDLVKRSLEVDISAEEFEKGLINLYDSFFAITRLGGSDSVNPSLIEKAIINLEYLKRVSNGDEKEQNYSTHYVSRWEVAIPYCFYGAIPTKPAIIESYQKELDDNKNDSFKSLKKVSDYLTTAKEIEKLDSNLYFYERTLATTKPADDLGNGISLTTTVLPEPQSWVFNTKVNTQLSNTSLQLLSSLDTLLKPLTTPQIIKLLRDDAVLMTEEVINQTFEQNIAAVAKEVFFKEIIKITGRSIYQGLADESRKLTIVQPPVNNGIRAMGIGDLMLVRQRLIGYELSEIAHIQNILQTENFHREYVRVKQTEETLTVETEASEQSENSLETTERFEMQREAEKTLEYKQSQESGLSITASYGPVSATARTDIQSSLAKSESLKSATKYAKEVTETSTKNITKRIREERVRRVLERTEERTEHGFDNSKGAKNITGVYRWVSKKYRNYLINYGKRLMLEFIVPEPAAFYSYAIEQGKVGVTTPKPAVPKIFDRPLSASDITEYNYQDYTALYNLESIPAYPQPLLKTGFAISQVHNASNNVTFSFSNSDFKVNEGYESRGVWGHWNTIHTDNNYFASYYFGGTLMNETFDVKGMTGTIPLSGTGNAMASTINLAISMVPTKYKIESWKNEVFSKIMMAYHQQLDAYNSQVAALAYQNNNLPVEMRPDEYRSIERDELKKGSLRLLTNNLDRLKVDGQWRFGEEIDAMKDGLGRGFPEFDVPEAYLEGKISQFFEQAFEWDNMTYSFYPYYWSRSSRWLMLQTRESQDPKFTEFLKAGAARVVIPVHPSYEKAIMHYLATKELWMGDGTVPTIGEELYISISSELKSKTDYIPPESLPEYDENIDPPFVVDSWESTLPTSLIYLQEKPELPSFVAEIDAFDVESFLDEKTTKSGGNLNWRSSVVDLLKVLGLDSSAEERRNLAYSLGYRGPSKSKVQNIWLHTKIIELLIINRGRWPSE